MVAAALFGAADCNVDGSTAGAPGTSGTWSIDCVAVLGAPPASARTPLAGTPYSGVPRDKLISELSDQELAQLCDFDACLRYDGYSRKCYTGGPSFQLEAPPVVSDAMLTCEPTAAGVVQDSWDNRENCMSTYRNYFATCHVGSWEDCLREASSDPLAAATWGPDCATTRNECPVY